MKLAGTFARRRKKVAIFSLEMTAQQFAKRCAAAELTKTQIGYIDICDDLMSVSELSTIVSRADKVDFIGVDFAELMLDGDSMQTEQTMANIYRTLAWVAKRLGVPVVLLSQLNRQHSGQLPNLTMLRYTGMAEALAALVLFLHNPTQIFVETSDALPLIDGRGYIIVAKSRFGYKDEVHSGVGAIQLGWDGKTGWSDKEYGSVPVEWRITMPRRRRGQEFHMTKVRLLKAWRRHEERWGPMSLRFVEDGVSSVYIPRNPPEEPPETLDDETTHHLP